MLLPGEIYCAAAVTGSVAFGSAALASTAFVPQTPLVRVYPKTPRRIASQIGTQFAYSKKGARYADTQ